MSGESAPRRTDPARRRSAGSARETATTDEREITLRAMRFHSLVGVLEHERTVRQPIEVDLSVRVASNNGILDYRRLYEVVERIMTAGPIDYLETAGDRIIRAAFEDSRILQARVAIRKPHVALPGPLAYAEVVVRRSRDAAAH
ncbi:MAG TPA: dihydroneopterin aldolase [Gemmatimonadaceae bacterium]|nr:dihydroneopterin aldolase [Gemmatimonadaceae bacterium]